METTGGGGAVRELLVVGGNLALDLANTVDNPGGPAHHDHLATYQRLLAWARTVDLITAAQAAQLKRVPDAETTFKITLRAQELREVIGQIFAAIASGRPHLEQDWQDLRPFVADALAHASLRQDQAGAVQMTWPIAGDPADLLHPIASAAADLLRGDELQQVKSCPQCHWLYVDRSKNHSRRWCSMQDCGTTVKMQRYIARRAAANQASRPTPHA